MSFSGQKGTTSLDCSSLLHSRFEGRHATLLPCVAERTVGDRAVHDGNFKRVSAFFSLLVSSKHFTDVHLKTGQMLAFDDAPNIQ